jgi:hypothetical protein
VPATGLGSQAYRREVLSIGRSSTGISARSLSIWVAVRYQRQVAIVGRIQSSVYQLIGRSQAYRHDQLVDYRRVLAGLDSPGGSFFMRKTTNI